MDDTPSVVGSRAKAPHLKKFGNSKHSSQLSVDSPLYDASEEDNTDDGSATRVSQPWTRTGQPPPGSSSIIQGGKQSYTRSANAIGRGAGPVASSRLAHVSAGEMDSGVDSPTYDGDVEMNTAVPSSKQSTATLSPSSIKGGAALPTVNTNVNPIPSAATAVPGLQLEMPSSADSTSSAIPSGVARSHPQLQIVASLNALAGPTITTPSSPVSSLYPDPPSSAPSTPLDLSDDDVSLSGPALTGSRDPSTPFVRPAPLGGAMTNTPTSGNHASGAKGTTPKFTSPNLPSTAPPDAATVEYDENALGEGTLVNPSMLSVDDIRVFVAKAIEGEEERPYKINPPPVDRPVRIYADGVYDMFHFGHSLQLRQAKLAFPSVHLLVGVCSDSLCITHKARTVLSHYERLESVRHCRWVDEVVPEAPWVIDEEFVERHGIDYVAHDEEPYADASGSGDIYGFLKRAGKFLPTRRTPGISTSHLLERLVSRYRLGDFDGKLEKIGHGELSARGSVYDDSRPASRMSSRPPMPPALVPAGGVGGTLSPLTPHSPPGEREN